MFKDYVVKALKTTLLYSVFVIPLANSCAQGSIAIDGIWQVSEQSNETSFMDVWQFDDGSFCELKYVSDHSAEMRCDESGTYMINDSLLIIEVNYEDGQPYSKPQLVQFKYQYIDNCFILEVLTDHSGAMKNMVTEKLIMVPRP